MQNWLQFDFVIRDTALEQEISKFYLQILSTEASYHIFTSQWPAISVKNVFYLCVKCLWSKYMVIFHVYFGLAIASFTISLLRIVSLVLFLLSF